MFGEHRILLFLFGFELTSVEISLNQNGSISCRRADWRTASAFQQSPSFSSAAAAAVNDAHRLRCRRQPAAAAVADDDDDASVECHLISRSSSALSQLYGTQATLEHHHFNHAVMILNSEVCRPPLRWLGSPFASQPLFDRSARYYL